jgi:hypothetical protein
MGGDRGSLQPLKIRRCSVLLTSAKNLRLVDELGCCPIQIDKTDRRFGNQFVQMSLPTMPRYFFNTHHDTTHIDEQGEELADQHAAWKEATVMAGQTLQSLDGTLKPGHDWKMEVADEFRNTLFALHIAATKPH